MREFLSFWQPYRWRIVFTSIGFLTAGSFLTLGFWKTILILVCCSIGYVVGMYKDKIIDLPELFRAWRNRW
ncbi:MAG: DUF2273 domain-containing protein [Sporomusa sp.]